MKSDEIFEVALDAMRELSALHPESRPITSAIDQLEYLLAVARGVQQDRSRVANINIGIIAVREVEGLDEAAAEKLHEAAYEARSFR